MARQIKTELVVKDKGTKKIKKFSDTTTSLMKKLAGPLAIGAVVTAFISIAQKTLEYGDKLGKLNTRLGVSVAMLDKLKQIADLSGVSFDSLTSAFALMARNINDASQGMGEAVSAFDDLGINVQKLIKLSPDEQFLAIAEAISKIENPTKRQATAMDILGRSAGQLLQMLPDLRQKLADTNTQWTDEKAKEIEDYNDQVTKLKESFSQWTAGLMAPVIKSINDFNDLFSDDNLKRLEASLAFSKQAEKNYEKTGRGSIEVIRSQIKELELLIAAEKGLFDQKEKRMRAPVGGVGVIVPDVVLKEGESNKKVIDSAKKVKEALEKERKAAEELEASLQKLNAARTEGWLEAVRVAEERLNRETEIENIIIEKEKETIEKQKELQKDLMDAREQLIERTQEFFATSFADTFADIITGASDAKTAFSDMALSMIKDLARLATQKAFMELFSSTGTTGGSFFASIGKIFGLAGGGPAQSGRPYVVGENGPELFVPNQNGTVVPNGATGGSSVAVSVSVDASNSNVADPVKAQELGNVIARTVDARVKTILASEKRYGGILRS